MNRIVKTADNAVLIDTLAARDARIAELERELAEARDARDLLVDLITEKTNGYEGDPQGGIQSLVKDRENILDIAHGWKKLTEYTKIELSTTTAQLAVAVGALEKIIQARADATWPFNVRADNMAKIAGQALASLPESAKTLREVVEAAVIAREAPDFGHAHALNTLWEKVDALAKLEEMP